MASDDTFDPYYKWFGIPPAEQPADNYRLLGVSAFESDPDVIENSADARMAALQTRKTGAHALLAEKLMNEVTQARILLLHPEKKAAYDKTLKASKPQPQAETPLASPQQPPTAQAATSEPVTPDTFGLEPVTPDPFGGQAFSQQPPSGPASAQNFFAQQTAGSQTASPPGFPAAVSPRKRKPAGLPLNLILVGGAAAVLLVLVAGGLAVVLSGGTSATGTTIPGTSTPGTATAGAFTLNIPAPLRSEVTVLLDGKPLRLPADGAISVACPAGGHSIVATRAGYLPVNARVNVTPGGTDAVSLAWQRAATLRLLWPAAERAGAEVIIDRKPVNWKTGELTAGSVLLAVEPGAHTVNVVRPDLSQFSQNVEVPSRSIVDITPTWAATTSGGSNNPGSVPAALDPNGIDLMAIIDPLRHTLSGSWKKENGRLTMLPGSVPAMVLPYELPENYRLQLTMQPLSEGDKWFLVTLPTRYGPIGIRIREGAIALEIHTKKLRQARKLIKWDREPHRVEYAMNNGELTVRVDNEIMFSWKIDPAQLVPDTRYVHKPASLAAVYISNEAVFAVENIRLLPASANSVGSVSTADLSKPVVFQGHCYRRMPQQLHWREAVKACEAMGGYLCCAETQAEVDFVTSQFMQYPGFWLGGNDALVEGDWKWINGAPFNTSLWPEGQPDSYDSREQYLQMSPKNRAFNDAKDMKLGFVCEWNTETPTPPVSGAGSELAQIAINPDPKTASPPFEIDGHTYCLIDTPATWYQAEEFCRKLGGHLCSVKTQDELKVLSEKLTGKPNGYRMWTGGFLTGSQWNWTDGAPFDKDLKYSTAQKEPHARMMLERRQVAVFLKGDNALFRFNILCEWDTLHPPQLQQWRSGKALPEASDRLAVPSDVALKAAAGRIATVYNLKAASSSRETALATAAVLLEAAETEPDDALRFTLLRKTYELAAPHQAPWIATRAIERLRDRYEFARTVTEQAQMLAYATQQMKTAWEPEYVLQYAQQLIKQSRVEEDFAGVRALYQHLLQNSGKLKIPAINARISAAKDQLAAIQEMTLEAETATATLQTSPGDIDAAKKRGLYLAVVHNNWREAMPLIARDTSFPLGQAAARLVPTVNGFEPRTAELDIAIGRGWISLADEQRGATGKAKADLFKRVARDWLRPAHLNGDAQQRQSIGPALGYNNKELPARPLGLVVNGLGGQQEVAPVAVDYGGARPGNGVFARFGGKAKIEYPVVAATNYVHEIDIELHAPGGRINFMYNRRFEGIELSIIGKKGSDRYYCELHHYQGSNYTWKGKKEFKVGERVKLQVIARPGYHTLYRNDQQQLIKANYDGDSRMQISVVAGSQFTLHRSYLRPHTRYEIRRIKYPRLLPQIESDWGAAAVANHARNMGLDTKPDAASHKSYVLPANGAAFVAVKKGGFRWSAGGPNLDVTLPYNYWIARNEVSQREWLAVTGANPSRKTGSPWLPVDSVNRTQAIAYCEALNNSERRAGRLPQGYAYRLPTEAEWVYAGMGGTGSMVPLAQAEVHCSPTSRYLRRDCGTGQPNGWGIFDMQGNASEWVLDAYTKSRAGGSTSPFAQPTSKTVDFLVMGGSWWQTFGSCNLASRRLWRDFPTYSIGLRPVLAPVR